MRKLLLSIIFFISSLNIFGQNWLWAKSAIGGSADEGINLTTDIYGNVYTIGEFNSPSLIADTYTMTNIGNADIFLFKYNSLGTLLWAKSFGGLGDDVGRSITSDTLGNIYVTGCFYSSSIIFGTYTLTGTANSTIFVAKLDSSGTTLWANCAGGSGGEIGLSVTVDFSSNVYVTGEFNSTMIPFGTYTITNTNISKVDIFLTKYDVFGNVVWAKSIGGSGDEGGICIVSDFSSNIFMTGSFDSPALIFGIDTLVNSGGTYHDNIFLTKFDSSGAIIWARSAGGSFVDAGQSVSVDVLGNAYITGSFYFPITFGTYTVANGGYSDVFLAKYNPSGSVLWARSAGGTGYETGYSLSTDISGNTYLVGGFDSPSITFGSFTLLSTPSSDYMFAVKYDSTGNVLCASALTSGGDDNSGVVSDDFGNAYIVGDFLVSPFVVGSDSLILGTGTAPIENIFVAKFTCGSVGINEFTNNQEVNTWPNPGNTIMNIELRIQNEMQEIRITNLLGEEMKEAGIKKQDSKYEIDISNLQNGIYFVSIKTTEGVVTKKIVVQH